jgi:hypothetical protein
MIDVQQEILQLTGAQAILATQAVQNLWSGYGEIRRYKLAGGEHASVIVKHIQWPEKNRHPRGWNTSFSHERKLNSYQVEKHWYKEYAHMTGESCKVPGLLFSRDIDSGLLLIMEDLDHSGYDLRHDPDSVQLIHVKNVLTWLANFHATFMGKAPQGLWEVGTYWHLATRPDEWDTMPNKALKAAAKAINERLNAASFQTFVHGDAKLANFCFSAADSVAAVDFQYVGQGCGMKDVAYFLSSCFEGNDCERYESELLDHYFQALKLTVSPDVNFDDLEKEWRELYAFAWADFYRFLDGWSPGHWKMHGYSKRLTSQVLKQLR